MLEPTLYKVVIDSLSAHIAILDDRGVIIETNRAWQDFAKENGMKGTLDSVGINYLSICEAASGEMNSEALRIAGGIRDVIGGEIDEFLIPAILRR